MRIVFINEYIEKKMNDFKEVKRETSFVVSLYMYSVYSLYKVTKRINYYNFVYEYYDERIDEDGNIKELDYINLKLEDFTFGLALIDLYEDSKILKFKKCISNLMRILGTSNRFDDGNFYSGKAKGNIYSSLDYLGGLLFYSKFVKVFDGYIDARSDIEKQIKNYSKYFYSTKDKIFIDYFDKDKESPIVDYRTGKSSFASMYNLSFLAFASIQIYKTLNLKSSKTLCLKIINGLKKYQENNSYKFVINISNDNNFIESSSNLLFSYVLEAAYEEKVLSDNSQAFKLYQKNMDLYFDGDDLSHTIEYLNFKDEKELSVLNYLNTPLTKNSLYGITTFILSFSIFKKYNDLFK